MNNLIDTQFDDNNPHGEQKHNHRNEDSQTPSDDSYEWSAYRKEIHNRLNPMIREIEKLISSSSSSPLSSSSLSSLLPPLLRTLRLSKLRELQDLHELTYHRKAHRIHSQSLTTLMKHYGEKVLPLSSLTLGSSTLSSSSLEDYLLLGDDFYQSHNSDHLSTLLSQGLSIATEVRNHMVKDEKQRARLMSKIQGEMRSVMGQYEQKIDEIRKMCRETLRSDGMKIKNLNINMKKQLGNTKNDNGNDIESDVKISSNYGRRTAKNVVTGKRGIETSFQF